MVKTRYTTYLSQYHNFRFKDKWLIVEDKMGRVIVELHPRLIISIDLGE